MIFKLRNTRDESDWLLISKRPVAGLEDPALNGAPGLWLFHTDKDKHQRGEGVVIPVSRARQIAELLQYQAGKPLGSFKRDRKLQKLGLAALELMRRVGDFGDLSAADYVSEMCEAMSNLGFKDEVAGTTQKGAGMTEPNKVDGNFELYDERTGKSLAVKVSGSHAGINIAVAGYGECGAQDGCGAPIFLEFYGGRLALHVWGDINQEDPTHTLDLKGALESLRKENL